MPKTRDHESLSGTETATPAYATQPSRRRWPLVLLAAAVLLAGAYLVAVMLLGDRMPRDTSVAGVPIGGMTPAEAASTLRRDLAPRADEPVPVTAGDLRRDVVPSDAGVTLDADATVAQASRGARWNPVHLWTVLTGGGSLDPVVAVDGTALAAVVEEIATEADTEPIDGSVRFDGGTVNVIAPVDGVRLDTDAAVEVLAAGLLTTDTVTLPVQATPPAVDAAEVERAVREFAEPSMSGPVVVTAGETTVELSPAEIGPHLTMAPDDAGTLQPAIDAAGLIAALPERFASLVAPPRDAAYTFENDKPKLIPALDGAAIDVATLKAGLLAALPATGDDRVAEATVATQEPDLTTEEIQALGIVEPISEFTTEYPVTSYRITNIGRAAELINTTLVLPGEIFSLNETVGERTAENGFVEGNIIKDGQLFRDFGGGVSQVATTTFNAVFFAGLEDVEHKPHSFYIGRYPAGREATVAWPIVDLRFRNDSDHGVLIQAIHTTGQITVRFWGTKVWDEIESVSSARSNVVEYETLTQTGEDCVDQDGSDGFDITVTRNFIKDGAVVRSEDFFTHYNPADNITCV